MSRQFYAVYFWGKLLLFFLHITNLETKPQHYNVQGTRAHNPHEPGACSAKRWRQALSFSDKSPSLQAHNVAV